MLSCILKFQMFGVCMDLRFTENSLGLSTLLTVTLMYSLVSRITIIARPNEAKNVAYFAARHGLG